MTALPCRSFRGAVSASRWIVAPLLPPRGGPAAAAEPRRAGCTRAGRPALFDSRATPVEEVRRRSGDRLGCASARGVRQDGPAAGTVRHVAGPALACHLRWRAA